MWISRSMKSSPSVSFRLCGSHPDDTATHATQATVLHGHLGAGGNPGSSVKSQAQCPSQISNLRFHLSDMEQGAIGETIRFPSFHRATTLSPRGRGCPRNEGG